MNCAAITVAIAGCALFGVVLGAGEALGSIGPRSHFDIEMFAQMDEALLPKALNNAVEARKSLEQDLIAALSDDVPMQARLSAVYLLGVYRMENAAPRLARMVDLHDPAAEASKKLPLWGEYPVVEALAKIGCPAVPHMIENIQDSANPRVRSLSLKVLRVVLGVTGARSAIDSALTVGMKDDTKVARLRGALTELADR